MTSEKNQKSEKLRKQQENIIERLIVFVYELYSEIEPKENFSEILKEINENNILRNDEKFMNLVSEIKEIQKEDKKVNGKILDRLLSYQTK